MEGEIQLHMRGKNHSPLAFLESEDLEEEITTFGIFYTCLHFAICSEYTILLVLWLVAAFSILFHFELGFSQVIHAPLPAVFVCIIQEISFLEDKHNKLFHVNSQRNLFYSRPPSQKCVRFRRELEFEMKSGCRS